MLVLRKTTKVLVAEMVQKDIKAIAHIKKVSTGEIRQCPATVWQDDYGINCFMWEDGNYSCDCNRRLFFDRAGDAEIDLDTVECGDGAYEVNIEAEGEIVYKEFENL